MIAPTRLRTTTTILVTFLLTNGCAPPPEIPTLTSDEMALVLSELLFYPEVTCEELRRWFDVEYLPLVDTPDGIGLAYEEHWLPIESDTELRLWYLPTNLNRGTVVLSQGSLGAMPCYLFHARMLAHNGWSVVMYEYRGFGGSNGKPDIGAMQRDLETVVDWTRAYTGHEQVTLMGVSLGAIPSVAVTVQRPDAINGVVLDSPVVMSAMIRRLEFALRSRTQEFIDRLAPEFLTEDLVEYMHQPLLVFLGERDQLTTPASIQLIYERAAGPKQIVRFPGVQHAREPFRDTGTYTYHLESFLSSLWSQRAPLEVEIRAPEGE
ncbi:MAG: alpha/beta hydrolase [Phycisphaerae bacterium]